MMAAARVLLVWLLLLVVASSMGQVKRCEQVKCSSWNYKYAKCRAGDYIRHIHVVKKHSKSSCTKGSSFGSIGRYVWVDHGCRATFDVCY